MTKIDLLLEAYKLRDMIWKECPGCIVGIDFSDRSIRSKRKKAYRDYVREEEFYRTHPYLDNPFKVTILIDWKKNETKARKTSCT